MNRHQKMAFELRVNESPEPHFINLVAWMTYRKERIELGQLLWADLAFAWCRLMHAELNKGKTIQEAIDATFSDVTAYYVTDIHVCDDAWHSVFRALETCWKHGRDLYAWHRSKFCK